MLTVYIALCIIFATVLSFAHRIMRPSLNLRFTWFVCFPFYLVFWPFVLTKSVVKPSGRRMWKKVFGIPEPYYEVWIINSNGANKKVSNCGTISSAISTVKEGILATGAKFAIKEPSGNWHVWGETLE